MTSAHRYTHTLRTARPRQALCSPLFFCKELKGREWILWPCVPFGFIHSVKNNLNPVSRLEHMVTIHHMTTQYVAMWCSQPSQSLHLYHLKLHQATSHVYVSTWQEPAWNTTSECLELLWCNLMFTKPAGLGSFYTKGEERGKTSNVTAVQVFFGWDSHFLLFSWGFSLRF